MITCLRINAALIQAVGPQLGYTRSGRISTSGLTEPRMLDRHPSYRGSKEEVVPLSFHLTSDS
ncbi:hypothetical protein FBZ99_10731 [Rhizobium sp. ERR 1071]|nr:hypothetical protein FBZ99_10731 [Rhizobium sp. ERR1071]